MKMTQVSEMGERSLVNLLSGMFNSDFNTDLVLGPGSDDCAVLDISDGDYLVVTTDMLHSKTDFPEQMTPWQIGWMSAAVNLSDVASMGARPIGILMAIGMSSDTPVSFVKEMARGMSDCAKACGTTVIGGDIDTHDELTITGTALGLVKKSRLLKRKGANAGDRVCVTGFTGSAGAALHALQHGIDVPDSFLNTLLEPCPRVAEGQALARSGAVTCMMDTSDGLAMSLHDLADINGVGFHICESMLPVCQDMKDYVTSEPEEQTDFALYTGGDFELLFTVSPEKLEEARNACDLSIIGEVVGKTAGIRIERNHGTNLSINRKGYLQLGT
ncbi:thiamine-phosphate kinase [Methanolobus halotolerans]|uniref:Thiamine-monophosphate kinase n=1 Tax=Methanolobus halotolerans TaxID=2052935 RepID=A0A4E0PZ49_9EURY|nr:thiamine-phosphate kinase [Methanolobus halotolerans]TGC10942.1 thiamine-phosphate kinase [Methanolobus halotolerans]